MIKFIIQNGGVFLLGVTATLGRCGAIGGMAAGFDPYAVLGLSRDATGEQITQARHQLTRRYHPYPDAAARFDEVQQAFQVLSNPADQARWDREHAEPASAGSWPGATAGRFTVFPASVDFGIVVRGNPGAWRDVVVTWADAPSERIEHSRGGEWWSVTHTGSLGPTPCSRSTAPPSNQNQPSVRNGLGTRPVSCAVRSHRDQTGVLAGTSMARGVPRATIAS
jgi:hypothetical protein